MPRSRKQDALPDSVQKDSDGHGVSLREEVKQALRNVMNDPEASAAAKASAGRTLLEFFLEDPNAGTGDGRSAREMTPTEIDEEINRLTRAQR